MNLIEKLKNAPKGTKLYTSIFGEVKFEKNNRQSYFCYT
jgi:hypothetical protein